MWFWSVSWSTNCPVYFSLFLVDQKKICSVSGNFWSVSEFFLVRLWFFGILKRNFGVPKRNLVNQKKSEPDQKFPETEQIFFGRPKKERNRLDNWSTKRLTKTTWTGLLFSGKRSDFVSLSGVHFKVHCIILFHSQSKVELNFWLLMPSPSASSKFVLSVLKFLGKRKFLRCT